jgi:PAS domain S-box-containing protein
MSTKGLRDRWSATIDEVRGRAHVGARRSRGALDLAFARQIGSPDVPDGPPVAQVLCDLLDHAPFGFALLDDQGRYRMVNRRLAAVVGVTAADHLGRRPSDLHLGAVDEESVARVLRTGTPGPGTRATVPDAATGAERHFLTSCYPVRSASGRVTAVAAMCVDVTEQELTKRRAEQLLHFSGLVGAVTSVDALASTMVRFVSSTLRARCAVGLVDGDRLRIAAVQGFTPEVCDRWMHEGFALTEPHPMTAAIRDRATVEIQSIANLAEKYSALSAERGDTGDAAVIAIPIYEPGGESAALGVLRVSWPYPARLDREVWTTLRTLVSMSELALSRIALDARKQAELISARVAEETDLLAQRRRIAVELLQRAALPAQLPEVEGVVLDALYRPATTVTGIGGDWYDAFALDEHRLGLVIADVAGHGEEAASFMVQVRNALRAMAIEHEQPHVVLERINAVALSLRDENAPFITCCYAVLDPVARTLTWSNAGHLDPLVVEANGGTYYGSAPHRPPLTVTREPQYTTTTIDLGAGDRVVMFTDGLVERRGEPIDEGLLRLARRAGEARSADPGNCLKSLLQTVEEQFDDLAVICADLVPAHGRGWSEPPSCQTSGE